MTTLSSALGTSTPESTELEESLLQFKQQTVATNSLFRGDIPLRPSSAYRKLTQQQVDRLAQLDIHATTRDTFVGGLITTRLKANTILDILAFKDLIEHNIEATYTTPEFQKPLEEYLTHQAQIKDNSIKGKSIGRNFRALYECKQSIGALLLPDDFLSLLKNPNGFNQTTLHRVGYYALTLLKEPDSMLNYHRSTDPNDLVDDLQTGSLFAPNNTPLESREETEPEPPTVKYPSIKQTRNFNNRRAVESKARLAVRLYDEIQAWSASIQHSSEFDKIITRQRRQKIARIRSLRPSMRTLKAQYRAQGDLPSVVNMLVTPEKYPDLPQVHLTKRMQTTLIDVINGKGAQHKQFIANGFMNK